MVNAEFDGIYMAEIFQASVICNRVTEAGAKL